MAVVQQLAHVVAAAAHAIVPKARDLPELAGPAVEPCIDRRVSPHRSREVEQLGSTAHSELYLSLQVPPRQAALGRDRGAPSHSALLKKSRFSVRYHPCTSDSYELLNASQPWHESHMAEHIESAVHASHSPLAGTVASVTRDGCELLSQPIKSSRTNTLSSLRPMLSLPMRLQC